MAQSVSPAASQTRRKHFRVKLQLLISRQKHADRLKDELGKTSGEVFALQLTLTRIDEKESVVCNRQSPTVHQASRRVCVLGLYLNKFGSSMNESGLVNLQTSEATSTRRNTMKRARVVVPVTTANTSITIKKVPLTCPAASSCESGADDTATTSAPLMEGDPSSPYQHEESPDESCGPIDTGLSRIATAGGSTKYSAQSTTHKCSMEGVDAVVTDDGTVICETLHLKPSYHASSNEEFDLEQGRCRDCDDEVPAASSHERPSDAGSGDEEQPCSMDATVVNANRDNDESLPTPPTTQQIGDDASNRFVIDGEAARRGSTNSIVSSSSTSSPMVLATTAFHQHASNAGMTRLWTAVPSASPSPSATSSSICQNLLFRWLCIAIVCIVIVPSATGVILVVFVPGAVFLSCSIVLYYCCTRDAIPLSVLLRSILFSTDEFSNSSSARGSGAAATSADTMDRALTTREIHAALTRRVCLAIVPNKQAAAPSCAVQTTEAPMISQHELKIVPDYSVVLERCTLYFSKVLDMEDDAMGAFAAGDPVASGNIGQVNDNESGEDPTIQVASRCNDLVRSERMGDSDMDEDVGSRTHSACEELDSPTTETSSDFARSMFDGKDRPSRDTSATNSCTDDDINDDDDSDSNSCTSGSPQRGAACDICLLPYEVNDVLAWSNNPLCNHAYHLDCVTDWIQASASAKRCIRPNRNQHSCPTCRYDFLYNLHEQELATPQTPPTLLLTSNV